MTTSNLNLVWSAGQSWQVQMEATLIRSHLLMAATALTRPHTLTENWPKWKMTLATGYVLLGNIWVARNGLLGYEHWAPWCLVRLLGVHQNVSHSDQCPRRHSLVRLHARGGRVPMFERMRNTLPQFLLEHHGSTIIGTSSISSFKKIWRLLTWQQMARWSSRASLSVLSLLIKNHPTWPDALIFWLVGWGLVAAH